MQTLIERVVKQIREDFNNEDVEALEELLSFVPKENLIGYLPEEEWKEYENAITPKDEVIAELKAIITEHGSFSTFDVMSDSDPVVNSFGGVIVLASSFEINGCDCETYVNGEENSIRDFEMLYDELTLETLQSIIELARQYKEISENKFGEEE